MPMPVPHVDARTLIRALVVLAVLTTVIIAFQQRYRVANSLQDPAGGHVSDFDRWMIMTPRFLHERVDYVNDELPTPPLTLIAFAPLTRLSRPDAVFVWVLVKLPLAWLVFALSAAIVARTGTRLTNEAIVLVIVAWALAVVADMQQGQTNFLALLPWSRACTSPRRTGCGLTSLPAVWLASPWPSNSLRWPSLVTLPGEDDGGWWYRRC